LKWIVTFSLNPIGLRLNMDPYRPCHGVTGQDLRRWVTADGSTIRPYGIGSDVLTCRIVWCINMSEPKFNATPCVSNGHFRAWPSQSVYAYILLHDLNTNIRNPFEIVGWRSHFRCPSMFRGKCQGPFQILLVNHGLTRNIFCHQPVDRTQSSGEPPSFVLVLQLPVKNISHNAWFRILWVHGTQMT
jgi:hypothetical protein